ncbi:hypothetical protein [Mycobacterium spongiae]|uniref:Uncharacterized protein n=1 Tax=Mycobacterium spongiae TaxID=886343 RepID=A0A975K171_9MYCO|nr:hypothetical protein [Mycobacterium spongiae]QUR69465.1 hypothetical protein F6B93_22430 [Mycobacterium spongiae]
MNRTIALTTGILAALLGAYQCWRAVRLLHIASIYSEVLRLLGRLLENYTTPFHRFVVWLNAEAALAVGGALALLLGAAMMFARRPIAPTLIVSGSAIVIAHTGIGWVVATRMIHRFYAVGAHDAGLYWFDTPNRPAVVMLSFILPVIGAVLALLPATRRSLRGDPAGGSPPGVVEAD